MPPNAPTLNPAKASVDLPFRFFVFGLLAWALYGAALPFFAADVLAQHHYTHRAIAFTHLITLGWITTIMIGAIIQLVPVALGAELHSERLARWTFWLHVGGVAGMVASFWLWNFKLLIWCGSLVSLGLGIFVYNILRTLWRTSWRDLTAAHLACALGYLVLTFLAGEYLMHDKLIRFSALSVIPSIHAHAHLAILGWFGLTMIGISYRVIPMFILSSLQSPRRAWTALVLLNAGIPATFWGILLQRKWLPAAALITATGLGFWLWEMMAIFQARRRPELDSPLRQVRVALFHLPLLFGIAFWLSWPGGEPTMIKSQAETSYALLALMGWLSLFIMAMLYKIIPFLIWYKIYSPLIGRQPVPRLQDLYSSSLQQWSLWLFLAGLWATAVTVALASRVPVLFIQISSGVMGLGILLFVVNMGIPIGSLIRWRVLPRLRSRAPLQNHASVSQTPWPVPSQK